MLGRRKPRLRAAGIAAVATALAALMVVPTGASQPVDEALPTGDERTPHPPIVIVGDRGPTGFALATDPAADQEVLRPGSGVVRGNGTAEEPYVIEGWRTERLVIKDTSAHVRIHNNTIHPETTADPPVRIVNATNVNVTGNRLLEATFEDLEDSQIRDNRAYRLHLDAGRQVNVTANEILGELVVSDGRTLDVRDNTVRATVVCGSQDLRILENKVASERWLLPQTTVDAVNGIIEYVFDLDPPVPGVPPEPPSPPPLPPIPSKSGSLLPPVLRTLVTEEQPCLGDREPRFPIGGEALQLPARLGLHALESRDLLVQGNALSGTVSLFEVDDSRLANNTLLSAEGSPEPLRLSGSEDNSIENNTLANGIHLFAASDGNQIRDNDVSVDDSPARCLHDDRPASAVLLSGSHDTSIVGNQLTAPCGVVAAGSTGVELQDNEVQAGLAVGLRAFALSDDPQAPSPASLEVQMASNRLNATQGLAVKRPEASSASQAPPIHAEGPNNTINGERLVLVDEASDQEVQGTIGEVHVRHSRNVSVSVDANLSVNAPVNVAASRAVLVHDTTIPSVPGDPLQDPPKRGIRTHDTTNLTLANSSIVAHDGLDASRDEDLRVHNVSVRALDEGLSVEQAEDLEIEASSLRTEGFAVLLGDVANASLRDLDLLVREGEDVEPLGSSLWIALGSDIDVRGVELELDRPDSWTHTSAWSAASVGTSNLTVQSIRPAGEEARANLATNLEAESAEGDLDLAELDLPTRLQIRDPEPGTEASVATSNLSRLTVEEDPSTDPALEHLEIHDNTIEGPLFARALTMTVTGNEGRTTRDPFASELRAQDIRFANNHLERSALDILGEGSVQDNTFEQSSIAARGALVEDNRFNDTFPTEEDPPAALYATGATVRTNSFENATTALRLAEAGTQVVGNRFLDNERALHVAHEEGHNVSGNTILDGDVGIETSASEPRIAENLVRGHTTGILVHDDARILANNVTDNDVGLEVDGDEAQVHRNNIWANAQAGLVQNEGATLRQKADDPKLSAENNWWGCPDGPEDPACDDVEASSSDEAWRRSEEPNVDYEPWLTSPNPAAGP